MRTGREKLAPIRTECECSVGPSQPFKLPQETSSANIPRPQESVPSSERHRVLIKEHDIGPKVPMAWERLDGASVNRPSPLNDSVENRKGQEIVRRTQGQCFDFSHTIDGVAADSSDVDDLDRTASRRIHNSDRSIITRDRQSVTAWTEFRPTGVPFVDHGEQRLDLFLLQPAPTRGHPITAGGGGELFLEAGVLARIDLAHGPGRGRGGESNSQRNAQHTWCQAGTPTAARQEGDHTLSVPDTGQYRGRKIRG